MFPYPSYAHLPLPITSSSPGRAWLKPPRHHLAGFLGHASQPGLLETNLLLAHPEWMFHLGPARALHAPSREHSPFQRLRRRRRPALMACDTPPIPPSPRPSASPDPGIPNLSRHAILCGHRHILDVGVSDGHCMAQARVFLYPNLAFIPKKHWRPSGWRTSPDPALRKYQFCIRRIRSIPRQIGRPAPWGPTRGWKGSSSLSKTEKEKGAPATSQKPSPGVP